MKKPQLSIRSIINMSVGFMGIQMGFALQNANVSRIFQTLGAEVEDIPILWLAAPISGLLIQPIVGYFSDRTWTRLGRRRPYFLVGAILASIALTIMPNSPGLWFAAIMLWVLDASINISMEPFRAFVGDNLPKEQQTAGFAAQTVFIGIGALIGSYLPTLLVSFFGVSNTASEGLIPESVKYSFYIGGLFYFLSVLWTVYFSDEYSPEELAKFESSEGKNHQMDRNWSADQFKIHGKKQRKKGTIISIIGAIATLLLYANHAEGELYILAVGIAVFGILWFITGSMQTQGVTENGFVTIMNDFEFMPKTMKQLAWVQFFSWFALFSMWIYTTAAITSKLFHTTDTTSALYNEGANLVGNSFGFYNFVSAIFAFLLPVLASKWNRKVAHSFSLVVGAVGLISIFFITNPNMLYISMIGIGVAWASILAMPYAILTGALPSNKMGYFMGVFNYFIVIPQIVAAAILGFVIGKLFDGQAIYALLIGGISFLISAILTMRVDDDYAPE